MGDASGRQSTNVPHAGKTSAVLNGVCPHALCNCSDKNEYLFYSFHVLAGFYSQQFQNLFAEQPVQFFRSLAVNSNIISLQSMEITNILAEL